MNFRHITAPFVIIFVLLSIGVITGLSVVINPYYIFLCAILGIFLILRLQKFVFTVSIFFFGFFLGFVSMQPQIPDSSVEYSGRITRVSTDNILYSSNGSILIDGEWKPFRRTVLIKLKQNYIELDIENGGIIWCSGKMEKTDFFPFVELNSDIASSALPIDFHSFGSRIKNSIITELENAGIESPVPASVIFGDKRKLTSDFKKSINQAGISHLLAVSGLHIGIFYTLICWFGRFFLLPRNWRVILALTVTGIYCISTGPSISCLRAYLIFVLYGFFFILDYPQHPLNILGLAGTIMIVINPMSIASAAFQLSFFSTAGILFLISTMDTKKTKPLKMALLVGIAAQGTIIPLSLIYFNSISLLAIPLTLIVVPVFLIPIIGINFAIYILSLIKIRPLTYFPIKGLNFLSSLFEDLISVISKKGFNLNFNPEISYLLALVAVVSAFVVLFWQSEHKP